VLKITNMATLITFRP